MRSGSSDYMDSLSTIYTWIRSAEKSRNSKVRMDIRRAYMGPRKCGIYCYFVRTIHFFGDAQSPTCFKSAVGFASYRFFLGGGKARKFRLYGFLIRTINSVGSPPPRADILKVRSRIADLRLIRCTPEVRTSRIPYAR